MSDISKKYLEAIVDEFGTEKSYSEEFCWEADVGNMVTPLEFASYCNNVGPDNPGAFCRNIVGWANDAAQHLQDMLEEHNAQCDPDDTIERDCSLLVDDILKNIAEEAAELLDLS